MEKWGGFKIEKENVILFDNTKESIQPLIEKLCCGNMKFAKDIEEKCVKLGKELPDDFKKQDAEEITPNYRELMHMMALMQESNNKIL